MLKAGNSGCLKDWIADLVVFYHLRSWRLIIDEHYCQQQYLKHCAAQSSKATDRNLSALETQTGHNRIIAQ